MLNYDCSSTICTLVYIQQHVIEFGFRDSICFFVSFFPFFVGRWRLGGVDIFLGPAGRPGGLRLVVSGNPRMLPVVLVREFESRRGEI